MRTDSDSDLGRASEPRLVVTVAHRFLAWPYSPWVVAPVALLLLWLFEAAIHTRFYPETGFLTQLFRVDAHEAWMRFLVGATTLLAAAGSSVGLRERTRRELEATQHERELADATTWAALKESESRTRLSERLHEGVGQELAAARLFLASVSRVDIEGEAAVALASVERILDRSITECREIAQELSPPVLDEFGLAPALEVLAKRVSRTTGKPVRVHVATPQVAHLRRDALVTAFHVITALLEEAVTCRETSSVLMFLTKDGPDVVVSLEWDGCGEPETAHARARLDGVGGSLVAHRVGEGASVQVRVPAAA